MENQIIKGWYKLKNGKIVFFDGRTTKTIPKNGKRQYIVTATIENGIINPVSLGFDTYYNEVEIVSEVDALREMQRYNALLKSFGFEIVKIS